MTQRVFDVNNEKDMQDLWDILPIEIEKLYHESYCIHEKTEEIERFIKINWHNKTEITRPIEEATEQDIGKLCAFWNYDGEELTYGKLYDIKETQLTTYFSLEELAQYVHARRLTADEIKELC